MISALRITSQITKTLLVALVLIGIGAFTMSQVAAQDADSLSLTAIPPRVGEQGLLQLTPGTSVQEQIRVRNGSNQAVTIRSFAQDFIVGEDGVTPIPVDTTVDNRWSMAEWMVVVPSQQTIQPGETVGVNVLIQVPNDALPGGHYAKVLHEPVVSGANLDENGEEASVAGTGINQQIGTLIYGLVDGPINFEAYIRDLRAPKFLEYGPVPFEYRIYNNSDVHIRPQATLEIYDLLNRKVDSITIDTRNIFPFTERNFEATWPQTWGWGKYTGRLVVSYGSEGQLIADSVTFWVFPVTIALAILVGLLTLIAVVVSIRRHLIHRNSDERKKIELLEKRLQEIESQRQSDNV